MLIIRAASVHQTISGWLVGWRGETRLFHPLSSSVEEYASYHLRLVGGAIYVPCNMYYAGQRRWARFLKQRTSIIVDRLPTKENKFI
jgi:hypothetical protein